MPIEQVQAGQAVWAYNHHAGAWEEDVAAATHVREVETDVITLTIEYADGSTESIEATGNHPFWVEAGEGLAARPLAIEDAGEADGLFVSDTGGRWVEARDVALGDQLLAHEFASATVVGLQIRHERLKVYNLTVERLRNYAVGEAGLVVHNNCPPQQLVQLTVRGELPIRYKNLSELNRALRGPGGVIAPQITVIGRFNDVAPLIGREGYNVLSIQNWSLAKNFEWVSSAARRGDVFFVPNPADLGVISRIELRWIRDVSSKGENILYGL